MRSNEPDISNSCVVMHLYHYPVFISSNIETTRLSCRMLALLNRCFTSAEFFQSASFASANQAFNGCSASLYSGTSQKSFIFSWNDSHSPIDVIPLWDIWSIIISLYRDIPFGSIRSRSTSMLSARAESGDTRSQRRLEDPSRGRAPRRIA